MPLPAATRRAVAALELPIREDAPLASRVSWKIGGPADGLVEIPSVRALSGVVRAAADTGCPFVVLGKGSNLLVADGGIRGLVGVLVDDLADVVSEGGTPPVIRAGAGLSLTTLLSRAQKARWTGLDALAGIPGTVGGAVVMNAGTSLGDTAKSVVDVDVVLADGTIATLTRDDLRMTYRTTHLPPGAIVASARLQTTDEDADVAWERLRAFLARRKETQPLTLPSCGSTFRNPPGDAAGRLIEAAGLKGFTIGGAQVSPKHANFVVNLGDATAADVRRVIEHIEDTVAARFGVHLEREVHYAGAWEGWVRDARVEVAP